jgi:hypothetical protein
MGNVKTNASPNGTVSYEQYRFEKWLLTILRKEIPKRFAQI